MILSGRWPFYCWISLSKNWLFLRWRYAIWKLCYKTAGKEEGSKTSKIDVERTFMEWTWLSHYGFWLFKPPSTCGAATRPFSFSFFDYHYKLVCTWFLSPFTAQMYLYWALLIIFFSMELRYTKFIFIFWDQSYLHKSANITSSR